MSGSVYARVHTVAFRGIEVLPIETQVHSSYGTPYIGIVGLPDKAVGESRERVRSAIFSMGLSLPARRLTINLAPADVVKEGSHFDLAIALGVLGVMGIVPLDFLDRYLVLGELALNGRIAAVNGALSTAVEAVSRHLGLICPFSCGPEAAWAGPLEIIGAPSLLSLVNHIKGNQVLSPPVPQVTPPQQQFLDLKDVKGQESAKRAVEVAAAGGHNLLMVGPPGSGKSMLASRLPDLLPPLTPEEALEVTMIHSVAGQLKEGGLVRHRPFRDPHHSASLPALVGGTSQASPGEVSLAHRGVLFLDELPEFSRAALEALRQPLESGKVMIARAQIKATYPACVQLVAAMNPCRCGYLGEAERQCSRAPRCGAEYQNKISGPLLDRIDLHIQVPRVMPQDLVAKTPGEGSVEIGERVAKAREKQRDRYMSLQGRHGQGGQPRVYTNSEANGEVLKEAAPLTDKGQALLLKATESLNLSARGYFRVLRVARTLADLENEEIIGESPIREALGYRLLGQGGQ
jgi:magnesium chelatase family protein